MMKEATQVATQLNKTKHTVTTHPSAQDKKLRQKEAEEAKRVLGGDLIKTNPKYDYDFIWENERYVAIPKGSNHKVVV